MYVEQINKPADLKKLTVKQLGVLSEEIRQIILDKVSKYGGHVGSDLGMVEATLAMHYVFNSPEDKIVFDVSHQSFAHKIITGRRDAFIKNEVSEYTNPAESEHDFFIMGHTSPAISLCCGLAKARDLKGEHENIIAIIGDGALSGGEAFEGLNNAAELGSNFIIVVNDNQWAIAENHGGMYKVLKKLRDSNGTSHDNYFHSLNLDYIYQNEGNNIQALIKTFQWAKDVDHPIVVHINTVKGQGYAPAIQDAEKFHYMPPFNLETGKALVDMSLEEDYSALTGSFLLQEMKKNPRLVAISSATPLIFGFFPDARAKAGAQFVDVGIAEEHAVAYASGLAKADACPVYGVYGTFLQRAYDQLSEDLCMNNNPAVILVFLTGVYGIPDQSHQCFFDIIELSDIPNMVYLAPICREEYFAMLRWAIRQTGHPVAIRVPTNGVHSIDITFDSDYSNYNTFNTMKEGNKVAVIAVGSFFQLGEQVVKRLEKKAGIKATLISPRYLTGVDTAALAALTENHELVITLEDGIIEGGYGQKIASYYGLSGMKVINYGFKKEFVDRYDAEELMKATGLTDELIVEDVLKHIE
ncbi:MAG: 1-deoxy-D-xylulose-5-phosphate synthase [Marinifilaceae bacterium]